MGEGLQESAALVVGVLGGDEGYLLSPSGSVRQRAVPGERWPPPPVLELSRRPDIPESPVEAQPTGSVLTTPSPPQEELWTVPNTAPRQDAPARPLFSSYL